MALRYALRQMILSTAVPAINDELQTQMSALGVGNVPQFGDSSVVAGDLSPVSQPTICIVSGGEQNERFATEGQYYLTLITQFRLKTTTAGDGTPEDFSLLSEVVTDNLRDLFTSAESYNITPKTPSGAPILPAGLAFQDCLYLGSRPVPFPQRESDKVTYTQGLTLSHSASIVFSQFRPGTLGS